MSIGQEPILLLSSVALPAFDYVALGHIHKQQVLNENPPVVYAGSLERVDFGEEDDAKGFYVVDITAGKNSKRKISYKFHPVHARRVGVRSEMRRRRHRLRAATEGAQAGRIADSWCVAAPKWFSHRR